MAQNPDQARRRQELLQKFSRPEPLLGARLRIGQSVPLLQHRNELDIPGIPLQIQPQNSLSSFRPEVLPRFALALPKQTFIEAGIVNRHPEKFEGNPIPGDQYNLHQLFPFYHVEYIELLSSRVNVPTRGNYQALTVESFRKFFNHQNAIHQNSVFLYSQFISDAFMFYFDDPDSIATNPFPSLVPLHSDHQRFNDAVVRLQVSDVFSDQASSFVRYCLHAALIHDQKTIFQRIYYHEIREILEGYRDHKNQVGAFVHSFVGQMKVSQAEAFQNDVAKVEELIKCVTDPDNADWSELDGQRDNGIRCNTFIDEKMKKWKREYSNFNFDTARVDPALHRLLIYESSELRSDFLVPFMEIVMQFQKNFDEQQQQQPQHDQGGFGQDDQQPASKKKSKKKVQDQAIADAQVQVQPKVTDTTKKRKEVRDYPTRLPSTRIATIASLNPTSSVIRVQGVQPDALGATVLSFPKGSGFQNITRPSRFKTFTQTLLRAMGITQQQFDDLTSNVLFKNLNDTLMRAKYEKMLELFQSGQPGELRNYVSNDLFQVLDFPVDDAVLGQVEGVLKKNPIYQPAAMHGFAFAIQLQLFRVARQLALINKYVGGDLEGVAAYVFRSLVVKLGEAAPQRDKNLFDDTMKTLQSPDNPLESMDIFVTQHLAPVIAHINQGDYSLEDPLIVNTLLMITSVIVHTLQDPNPPVHAAKYAIERRYDHFFSSMHKIGAAKASEFLAKARDSDTSIYAYLQKVYADLQLIAFMVRA
jgi:hypothetical protein